MSATMTRALATRWTLFNQLAAVGLGAGIVFLGMRGVSDRPVPNTETLAPPGAPATPAAGSGTVTPVKFEQVDTEGIAARLAMLDNAPDIPEPTPIDTQPSAATTTEPPEGMGTKVIGERVTYLGMVRIGTVKAAFLKVDGKQQIAREGSTVPPGDPVFSELRLTRVTASEVTLTDGELSATLVVEGRSGPSVTMVSGAEIEAAELPDDDLSGLAPNGDTSNIPRAELERRRRMIERARSGHRNSNPNAGLRPPEIRRSSDMSGAPTRVVRPEEQDDNE